MQNPLVSCLVTAYNYERFLEHAVESALAQDYPELEVIVVNDGSSDRTGEVADALAARHGGRVRTIHQDNGGWTSAFNRAIAEARGELLAILDADDTWLPGKLRAQVDLLAAHSEIGLVYSDLAVIDESGAVVEPSFWKARGVQPFAGRCAAGLVTVGNTATTSSIVVRAAFRDAFFPIPEDVPYGDWWIAFRTACVAEIAFLREPLSGYRFHGGNLTLNAEGERLVRELRKEHQLRRVALARLDPGVLTVAETMNAFGALEASARTTLAAAGSVFCSLPPALPDEAQTELASAEGAGPIARLRHLLRAVALDPWNDEARKLLASAGDELAGRANDREQPEPDGFIALGFLEEIVGTPDLLADYARVFEGRQDATLVVLAPGFDGDELGRALEPVASALGLDREEGADVVVLTENGADERLATVADALYTRVSRNGCFQHLPQIPQAKTLLDFALGDEPAVGDESIATELPELPDRFAPSILSDAPPWAGEPLHEETVPGMITDEEKRYFRWIGRTYAGAGGAVELGPWLGCSTSHIVAGLDASLAFAGRKLHVYDDFVWRSSWMDGYYDLADRPENHGDFKPIFDRYAAPIADKIVSDKVKFVDYDGNQALPQLEWKGGAIEIMYIDCGRTIEANEAWWKIFAPHFVPGETLVIMQDWQLWKEQPPQWYNQTKEFTDSKGTALELLHELRDGAIGTFLYKGEPQPQAEPEVAAVVELAWERLLVERPQFHQWQGAPISWNNGNPGIIERFLQQGMKTLETGSGYSTIVFAGAGCAHVSVTPEQIEADRITAYCREKGYRMPAFHVGASEDVLPTLSGLELDAAFIDGAHAFPHPMIDWYYIDRMLKVGGLLFVDDLQLMPCFLLDRYLSRDGCWEDLHREGNLAVYRKLDRYDFPHDYWGAQAISAAPVEDLESFLAGIWPEAVSAASSVAPPPPMPTAAAATGRGVLVAGMHRSGTSAVARVVDLLGVSLGDADSLVPPAEDNPTGFWENRALVELNEAVLAARGGTWCDVPAEASDAIPAPLLAQARGLAATAGAGGDWTWKDPRLCLTLPFWRNVLDREPVVILPYRNPLEIWRSLKKRNGIDKQLALAVWERYVRRTLAGAAGLPVFVLPYGALLRDPARVAERLSAFLREHGVSAATDVPPAVAGFIDEGLRHASYASGDLAADEEVSEAQVALYEQLDSLVGPHASFATPALPAETPSTEAVLAAKRAADRAYS